MWISVSKETCVTLLIGSNTVMLAHISVFTKWLLSHLVLWQSSLDFYISQWHWPSFKATGAWKSEKFCTNYLSVFSFSGNDIWYVVKAFEADVPTSDECLVCHNHCSRVRTSLKWFHGESKWNVGLCLSVYGPVSFKFYVYCCYWT